MSTVKGFQVGSETLKYDYESLDNYNTPNFSTSSSTTYAVGDYVMYNGKLYKCTTATTGGTWVDDNWTETVLSDDVSDLSRQISDVNDKLFNRVESKKVSTNGILESGAFRVNGMELSSTVGARTKLNYHTFRDNISCVSCDEGYDIYIRAWRYDNTTSICDGYYHADGTFSQTGTQQPVKFFDLTKYPQYYFRFTLFHEDPTVPLTPTEAEAHFHITEYYYGDNNDLSMLQNQSITGNRETRFYYGTMDKNSDGILRIGYHGKKRVYTLPIEVNAGDIIQLSANGYKFYIQGIVGDLYNVLLKFQIPTSGWQNDLLEYKAHGSSKVIIGFANETDDTQDIDLDDLTSKVSLYISERSMQANAILRGKRLSVLGDSISTYEGYIPSDALSYYPKSDVNNVNRVYWMYLALQEDMVIDTINAYGGTTVATKWTTLSDRPPFTDSARLENLGTPDYIIVYGGINDFGGNPLGDYPVDGTYTNMYEFRTAYAYMLSQLKQLYPSARIVCMTLLTTNSNYSATGVYPVKQAAVQQALATDTTPHYMYEFNESIIELAKRYECSVCDISDCMNYYDTSNESIDGVHPKAIVQGRIKEKLRSTLLSIG